MKRNLLVPLRQDERVEDFVPYLDDMAHTVTKIIFLVRERVNHVNEFTGHLLTLYMGTRADLLASGVFYSAGRENRHRAVERQIIAQCEKLLNRGVRIAVDVYTGDIRRVVEDYVQREEAQWVMMQRRKTGVLRYLRAIGSRVRNLEPESTPPVVLLHATDGAQR